VTVDPEEEDSSVIFPDLMEECYLWDCAGVTIGRTEVRIISLQFNVSSLVFHFFPIFTLLFCFSFFH
jgi:hypothetical protein